MLSHPPRALPPMTAILLFDLDGTVIRSDGLRPSPGHLAVERTFQLRHGVSGVTRGVRFAGGTDRALIRAMLSTLGLAPDAIEAEITPTIDAYVATLEALLLERAYHAIGDVGSAIAACHARGWCVGIGTGNARRGADLKLRSANLAHLFDLDRGGFGDDAEARATLLAIGRDRCRAAIGRSDVPTVVIGDTRLDVDAARAIGASVVGVAATEDARLELEQAGADAIVDDCGLDVVDAIAAVLAP
jgi:phosphoglycolate phosphatase-like HAD superfamily hydrolase